jgi:cytochrome P450
MPQLTARGRQAPGPPRRRFSGCDADLRRDPLQFMRRMRDAYGDVVEIPAIWPLKWYLISHPSHVEHLFGHALTNYPKGLFASIMKVAVGRGLIALDGDTWLKERRLLQPLFHRHRLGELAPVMVEAAERSARRAIDASGGDGTVDVGAEMVRLVLEISGRTLFGVDLSPHAERVIHAMTANMEEVHLRLMHPVAARIALPTPSRRRRRAAGAVPGCLAEAIVADRRKSGEVRDDLVGRLLAAQTSQAGLPEEAVIGETNGFLVASYETSAATLTWCWLMLATHPDVERRVHDELDRVLAGRRPSDGDLGRLVYLRMVIDETLRLYPPVPYFGRVSQRADSVGGYHIPAGTVVTTCAWVTHRHPEFWENPDDFMPERFDPSKPRPPHGAYFPFGGGPRQCIGAHFGQMEVTLALATMAQQLRMRLAPGHVVEAELVGTLHARPGIRMVAERRTTRRASVEPS